MKKKKIYDLKPDSGLTNPFDDIGRQFSPGN